MIPRAFRLSPKTVQFIAVGCAVALVAVITWQIIVQSPPDTTVESPPTTTVHSPLPSEGSWNSEIYPVLDVTGFSDILPYKPEEFERQPKITADGAFAAFSDEPFFTVVATPITPRTREAVSMLTVGAFANNGEQEDSVFVGWVRDQDNYITAWYNHTRKDSGLNVKVEGELWAVEGETQISALEAGDRLALAVDNDKITSYVYADSNWESLRTFTIGDALTPQHHYGFGLRATSGTITLAEFAGRSR